MRYSTSARRRQESRRKSGLVGRTALLRVAAGMLGLALVGSVGVGAMASSPEATDSPAAASDTTQAAVETTEAPAADAAPTAEQLPADEVPAAEAPSAPAEEPATDGEAAAKPAVPTEAVLAVPAAPKAPSLKEAPAVQALAAPKQQLTCGSGVVYTINGDGKIRQVSTSNGAQTDVGSIESGRNLNSLALTKGGTAAYAVHTQAVKGPGDSRGVGDMTVYRYDSVLGTTTALAGAQNIKILEDDSFVMGGINPVNGIYYYGRVAGKNLELYAFNTSSDTNIGYVGAVIIPNDKSGNQRGNGDLVFSSDGTLYFVASSGGGQSDSNALMEVDKAAVPTTAGDRTLSATLVQNLSVRSERFNGIAFEGGDLYLDTSSGNFYRVDASNGSIEKSFGQVLSSPVDMASCQYNNSLKVQKNIVSRVSSSDQFTMTSSAGNEEIGAPGTTTGSAIGLQEGPGTVASSVPNSGTEITIREVGTPGTNLAQYSSSWICKNQAGGTVASGTGTSGKFTFPPQSGDGVNVTCVFTNQPLSAKVTVTKSWVNAIADDTASFTANTVGGNSTAPANGNVISTSFAQGTQVVVSEVLGAANKGRYTSALRCTSATGTVVASGGLTGSFTLGASDVTCAFTNTNTAATVVVDKKWIVDGKPYNNGEQPKGITAALALTGPGSAGASPQEWAKARTGYFAGNTVTIAETTIIDPSMACKLTGSRVTLANGTTTASAVPYAAVLASGANTYTVTNTVECTTALTLLKFIDQSNGGNLVPGDFTLKAQPSTGPALTVAGANAVAAANTKSVTAGMNYALTESSLNKPAYLQLSLQRYTGTLNADKSLANPDAWVDAESATVQVSTGKHEIYRFVNASVPAFALPLTGGTGNWSYTIIGGGILLLAVIATAWILVRRTKTNRQ